MHASVAGTVGSGGIARPRFEERELGVFDRLNVRLVLPHTPEWAEYQRYLAETGEEPAPAPAKPLPTLEQAIAEKLALVENLAGQVRKRVTGRASPAEMATWALKVQQAQAFLQTNDPIAAPLLTAEASARGTQLEAIVARVMNNARAHQAAESAIAGAAGKHKDTIRGLTFVPAVLAYDIDAGWSPYWP